jgi:beta-xylosidase
MLFLLSFPAAGQAPQANLSDSSVIRLADPAIFYHSGTYYLYGTVEGNSNGGFWVYTSQRLRHWKRDTGKEGYALNKGEAFGTAGFWAPQVFRSGPRFYMAYTANEQIALAEADRPEGPFLQKTIAPLQAPVKQIDPFVFQDDDGKKYLYHVRLQEGNSIYVAELEDDLSAIKPETLRSCIRATEPWENTQSVPWPVAEGPSVLKRKGIYYLFYSANDFRNPDYAVGYATSNSPLGPWTKYAGNPVLHRRHLGENGTGHGDFIAGKKGPLLYVFHTHDSGQKVGPRKTAIIRFRFRNGAFRIQEKTFRFLRSGR